MDKQAQHTQDELDSLRAVNADLLAACEAAAAYFKDTDAPLGAVLRAAIAKARP